MLGLMVLCTELSVGQPQLSDEIGRTCSQAQGQQKYSDHHVSIQS